MQLPRPPPHFVPSMAMALGGDKLSSPAVRDFIASVNASYSHWDDLRHRPPPAGLRPEVAWQIVKLSRIGSKRPLPLLDANGNAFSYWLPTRAQETLSAVDRWGGGTLAVDGGAVPAFDPWKEQVLVSSLMEEAIATSQIEGAATTRKVAKEMLRTNRRPRDRGEQMVVNSYKTIELLRDRKEQPLSLDLLFEIQASMTRDTLDDPSAAGRLRRAEDEIAVVDVETDTVLFTPPPADQLDDRISKLVRFTNTTEKEWMHPLVKAAIIHFWLAYEHPFVEGNGRTARALYYWFMLKNGYWLFEFLTVSRAIARSRQQYYRSFLYSEHDDGDLTYSVMYQLDATKKAFAALREYLQRKQEEQVQLARTLRAFPELNHRQRELLDHALRHPEQLYTFQSHQRSQGVTYVTARNDLLDLVERRLLASTQQGRQRAFYAAEDLAKRLRGPHRRGRAARQ
jgi:Fic family protein